MGCNCRKNRVVYTGPPVERASESNAQTGGQAPVQDAVTAGARPSTPQR
jgi:hypothetical protein